jgi:hypothetical protein
MKPLFLFCLSCLLAGCAVDTTKIDLISGLPGIWKMETESEVVYESWTQKSDCEFAGTSYLIRAGDTIVLETIRIIEEGEELFYIPTVSNQNDGKPVRFTASLVSSTKLVFENAAHDFPQKISYRWITADSMVAEISGTIGNEIRKREFPMKRIK